MRDNPFAEQAQDYAKYRPDYPPELFAWLAEHAPAHKLAWDVGCGNGQATVPLASYFAKVSASDTAAEQIQQARAHERVSYQLANCNNSGLADASCDLITVAQAIHWFDFDSFYAEAKRVLRPGGLIAAWTYTLLQGELEINQAISSFYQEVLSPWWPPQRRWVDLGYVGMPFPFSPIETPSFIIHRQWTLTDMLNYVATWSAVKRCRQAGGADPIKELEARLLPCWGDTSNPRAIFWPIAMRAGSFDG